MDVEKVRKRQKGKEKGNESLKIPQSEGKWNINDDRVSNKPPQQSRIAKKNM